MMEIRTALKCFNQRKCRFLTPCFYVCKRPVSISVKRGFYARKIPTLETRHFIDYINRLNEQYSTGRAREHSYRPALQILMSELIPDAIVTNEPARIACGAPDYILTKKKDSLPFGFIEAKDLNDPDLEGVSKNKEQFDRYYELLIEWNRVMNLTGITAYEEVNLKHFTDSLTIVRINDMKNVSTLIDIGTGAGFPGIPIKIAFPHIKVVLLDSLNKRIKFLNEVVEKLNLDNVETLHGRAEDYAKKAEYREQFDMCVSRAVANLSTLGEYCIPFVKKGGCFVSYKSADSDEEINQSEKAISILGGKISKIDKFMLPGSDMGRALVVTEKDKNTPQKYPRKAGVPSKEPL